jgi:hypothetical protein
MIANASAKGSGRFPTESIRGLINPESKSQVRDEMVVDGGVNDRW